MKPIFSRYSGVIDSAIVSPIGFMKTVVGAAAEQERLFLVRALVEVMSLLVVERDEVLAVDSMHTFTRRSSALSMSQALAWQTTSRSLRAHEQGALPECRRQRRESERLEEALAGRDLIGAGLAP